MFGYPGQGQAPRYGGGRMQNVGATGVRGLMDDPSAGQPGGLLGNYHPALMDYYVGDPTKIIRRSLRGDRIFDPSYDPSGTVGGGPVAVPDSPPPAGDPGAPAVPAGPSTGTGNSFDEWMQWMQSQRDPSDFSEGGFGGGNGFSNGNIDNNQAQYGSITDMNFGNVSTSAFGGLIAALLGGAGVTSPYGGLNQIAGPGALNTRPGGTISPASVGLGVSGPSNTSEPSFDGFTGEDLSDSNFGDFGNDGFGW